MFGWGIFGGFMKIVFWAAVIFFFVWLVKEIGGRKSVRNKTMNYGYKKQVSVSFEEAVQKTRDELSKEGFGVLTEIDVKATLKKKLDVEYDNYLILGVCNPPFAYEALKVEKDIGLLLPCNVIVYEDGGKTFVSAILPTAAMEMVENPSLADIAAQVEEKLKKVVDNIN